MSDTIRESILNNIKTTIEGITTIKTVRLQEFSPLDLERFPLPAAFIFPESETRGVETVGYEQWRMTVVVEIWGKNMDLEDMLGKVHKEMYTDRTRGGYAIDTVKTGSELLGVVEPSRSLGSAIVRFEIEYRHKTGDPYSSA